jgi:hypothetical protein
VLTLNRNDRESADRFSRDGPFCAQEASRFSAARSRSRRRRASQENSQAAPAGAFPKGSKTRATMFGVIGGQFMNAAAPSTVGTEILARRLRELAGDERNVQVDFLLHLDEFDRRLAFREAGYDSLWTYCLQALHLREGPAGRRIGAMRVLRRFPALEGALRDGRLCISTVTLLGPLLTAENLDDLVARAAYRTKAEVEHLVAAMHPRVAPKEGIRKLPDRATSPAHDISPTPPCAVCGRGAVPVASRAPTRDPFAIGTCRASDADSHPGGAQVVDGRGTPDGRGAARLA